MAIAGRPRGSGPNPRADVDAARGGPPPGDRPAEFRYGVVFLLVLTLVVFLIIAPAENWARAVALALEGAALIVAIATSRVRPTVRRRRALVGAAAGGIGAACVLLGIVPQAAISAIGAIIAIAIPLELAGGLLRLVRRHGVTLQAVAGTLAIYLLVGLVFAFTIGSVARLGSGAYFAQGTDGTEGQHVYYSFTVLTTTGFGDLTAGTPVGRAIAVVEMLVGQLYLVTVIGLVVGNFAGRRLRQQDE
jgi:ion channel